MAFQTNALPMVIRERAAARLTKFVVSAWTRVLDQQRREANENALKLAFKITGRTKAVRWNRVAWPDRRRRVTWERSRNGTAFRVHRST